MPSPPGLLTRVQPLALFGRWLPRLANNDLARASTGKPLRRSVAAVQTTMRPRHAPRSRTVALRGTGGESTDPPPWTHDPSLATASEMGVSLLQLHLYVVVLQATPTAGDGRAGARPSPRRRGPCELSQPAIGLPPGGFSYAEKRLADGMFRCARRLSPITGRARSIRRSPSESVRCDRPSANLEVS